jgi:uncharacterized protein YfaP (DUF2135 family)|tara:strand:- start:95 stop:385 length:291 start_codon:yes stop_codon:yes gene_type:complete
MTITNGRSGLTFVRYPGPPVNSSQTEMASVWSQLIRTLEMRDSMSNLAGASQEPYIVSNVSVNRTYDVSAGQISVSVVANALGTLLQDLKLKGIIG